MAINGNLLQEIIAKKIRGLRESRNVTQDALAKILDISRPTLISYEIGKQSISVSDLYTLADYFDLDITELLPSLEEIKNLSKPEAQLDKNKFLPSGTKEEIREFIEEIRKG